MYCSFYMEKYKRTHTYTYNIFDVIDYEISCAIKSFQ